MNRPIQILMLDAAQSDAELNERELRKGGIDFTSLRVDAREAFESALDSFHPDLILADFNLPDFNGMQSLAIARQWAPDVPYIFVSGAMDEEMSAAAIRQGAADCLLKDKLARLPVAIWQALERKNLELQNRHSAEALYASEERLRTIFETEAACIKIVDGSGNLVDMNPAGLAILEANSLQEAKQKALVDYIDPRDKDAFIALHRRVMGGDSGTLAFRINGLKGTERWLETQAVPMPKANGEIAYLLGVTQDITERRYHEETLKLHVKRAQLLLGLPIAAEKLSESDFMQHGVQLAESLTGSRIAFIHFVGDDEETIELVTWSRRTIEENCDAAFDKHYPVSTAGICSDAMRNRQAVIFNDYAGYPHKHGLPDGHAELQRLISVPVIENGKVVMLTGVGNKETDYTDLDVETVQLISNDIWRIVQRKRNEAILNNRETRLSLALDVASQAWFDLDIRTGKVEASPEYVRLLGLDQVEYEPSLQTWIENLHPDDVDAVMAAYQTCLTSDASIEIEYRRRNGSGGWTWLHSSAKVVEWDADHKASRMIGIHTNIEARKQAELTVLRASRSLISLGEVNRVLVHATDELGLLSAVCDIIVEHAEYRMAWVGYLDHGEDKTVQVMAKSGVDEGYLENADIVWADTERGCGPTGLAARTGLTQVTQRLLTDPCMSLWREAASQRGYASSIHIPLIDEHTVFGVLTIYASIESAFDAEEIRLLEQLAGDLAFGVRSLRVGLERDTARQQVLQQLIKLEKNLEDTIKSITTIVELRDPYTAGHEGRVAGLAKAIAKQMGLPDDRIKGIYLAGEVHDLGKIQIPAELLSKPARLNAIEYGLIKVHPQAGYDILKSIDFPWPIAQIVLQHHERLDGSGYPQGLRGDEILLEARILCVADVVEAMSSHRPYRPGLGMDSALDEIRRGSGSVYDPVVAEACLNVFAEGSFKF